MARRLVPAVILFALAVLPPSAHAVPGELTQLTGTQGCVSDTGSGGECEDGRELSDALSVTVSPDGRSVYTAALTTVAIFGRNLTSGAISQLMGTDGCVSNTGSGGECADGTAIGGEGSTVVSPDGRHVYAAGQNADAISAFSRNPGSGVLTQLGGIAACVSETGSGGDCEDGVGLDGSRVLAISSDGLNLYVPSVFSDAIAVFRRDPTSGALTQLGGTAACVSDDGSGGNCDDVESLDTPFTVTVSPDGRHVYAAVDDDDAVTAFARNPSTGALTQLAGTAACVSDTGSAGACVDGRGLNSARGVAVSPDGESVYVGSNQPGGVAILARDPSTGSLTQAQNTTGCVSDNGSGGECVDGTALGGGHGVAVSPDNLSVYLAADDGNSVSTFARSGTGGLTQLAGTAGCTSTTGTGGACVDGRGLRDAEFVTVSPDCRNVYTAAEGDSAVAVFAREAPQACPAQTTTAVAVRKTASSSAAAARNGEVRYTMTVANTGTDAAESVTVEDRLPANVTFRSATASGGGCSQASGTVTCRLGTLAPGGSERVEIVVIARECGELANTATVTSTAADANTADNSSTARVDVNENCPEADQPSEDKEGDAEAGAVRGESGSGGELPFTGFALVLLAVIGAGALLGGLALRRMTRR